MSSYFCLFSIEIQSHEVLLGEGLEGDWVVIGSLGQRVDAHLSVSVGGFSRLVGPLEPCQFDHFFHPSVLVGKLGEPAFPLPKSVWVL